MKYFQFFLGSWILRSSKNLDSAYNVGILGEPSRLEIAETWEKFPRGDDLPAPYPTWELFEFSMTPPPPVGKFSQVSALFNFEGSPNGPCPKDEW